MRYLSIFQILEIHRRLIDSSGGSRGIRDFGALESALAQPEISFDGKDLYPSLIEKAGALAYSLCMNHPFIDGNKRISHAAMEIFLVLNDFQINATIDEQEKIFLNLASGNLSRKELIAWLGKNVEAIQ